MNYIWNFVVKYEMVDNNLIPIYVIENIDDRVLFWQLYILNKIKTFKEKNLIIPFSLISNFDYKNEIKLNPDTFELLTKYETIQQIDNYLENLENLENYNNYNRKSITEPILTKHLTFIYIIVIVTLYIFIHLWLIIWNRNLNTVKYTKIKQ